MSQGLITHATLEDIADAIRSKLGTEDTYLPSEMADAIRSIGGSTPPEIVSWANGTDEQLAAMIAYAHENPNWSLQTDGGWAVGDVRTITVGSFADGAGTTHSQQSIDIAISSFDDYMSCECVMQFDFKDALTTPISMMDYPASTRGGYGVTRMKTTTLPALVNALPTWLKDSLIEFSVLSSNGTGSSDVGTVTGNKLALRSEIEIFGSVEQSRAGEGSQIAYYTIAENRIKKRGHSGSANSWYERSPKNSSADSYCTISYIGAAGNMTASNPLGIAPFGCL